MQLFSGKFFVSVALAMLSVPAIAQSDDYGTKYANTITEKELEQHLSVLASDFYEGRETGTRGLARAADYISKQFQLSGIPPLKSLNGYYQEYPLIEFGWGDSKIITEKASFVFMQDFIGYAGANNSLSGNATEIVFLGYGIDDSLYSDYRGIDVKNKVVIVAAGEPMRDSISRITGKKELSAWSTDWRKKSRSRYTQWR